MGQNRASEKTGKKIISYNGNPKSQKSPIHHRSSKTLEIIQADRSSFDRFIFTSVLESIMSDTPPDEFHYSDPPPTRINVAEESGTTSVAPMSRKTRELPNLAECHSCGFRTNTSNGQDKLRSLHSEWRVVLLCGKCYRRCVRGELCTYCLGEFSGKVDEERFECGECCRCVHRDCVCKLGEFPPWSYFDWRSSSVCVDCWLPSKVKKLCDVKIRSIGGVFCGSNGKKKLMEGSGKDEAEKGAQLLMKPRMALKDKEKSLCKAVVVKSGVGKENGDFGFVPGGGLGQKGKGVDDAELAIELHRVMNSSPRILSNPKSSSISFVNVLKRRAQAGRNVSSVEKPSFGQRNCDYGGGFELPVNNESDSKDEGGQGILKEGQGSCSNNSMDSESFLWKELDLPKPELKFTYVSRKSRKNVGGGPDRYMFKYSRKRSRLTELVAHTYTYLYDRSTFESETSSSAIVTLSSNDARNFPDS